MDRILSSRNRIPSGLGDVGFLAEKSLGSMTPRDQLGGPHGFQQ